MDESCCCNYCIYKINVDVFTCSNEWWRYINVLVLQETLVYTEHRVRSLFSTEQVSCASKLSVLKLHNEVNMCNIINTDVRIKKTSVFQYHNIFTYSSEMPWCIMMQTADSKWGLWRDERRFSLAFKKLIYLTVLARRLRTASVMCIFCFAVHEGLRYVIYVFKFVYIKGCSVN